MARETLVLQATIGDLADVLLESIKTKQEMQQEVLHNIAVTLIDLGDCLGLGETTMSLLNKKHLWKDAEIRMGRKSVVYDVAKAQEAYASYRKDRKTIYK